MNTNFSMKHYFSIYILVALFLFHNIGAVNWINDPNITDNVLNDDINVQGVNAIAAPVHVTADGGGGFVLNMNINADSTIRNADSDGRLYLSAAAGNTIQINVDNNLRLTGTFDDLGNMIDFLVSFTGDGELNVVIGNDQAIEFTSDPLTGGAQFFLGMDGTLIPDVFFRRADTDSLANAEVVVGPKGCITYLAETSVESGNADETGSIRFIGDNLQEGCLILRIQDCGRVVIGGQNLQEVTLADDFTFVDINFTEPSGLNAEFIIGSELANATHRSLQVINENKKLTELFIDPFKTDDFNGIRWGFILMANANFTVSNGAYLDYIGTATNLCPVDCEQQNGACCDCDEVPSLIKERNPSAFFVDGNNNQFACAAQINLLGTSGMYFRSGVDRCGNVNEADGFIIDFALKTPGPGEYVFSVEGLLNIFGDPEGDNGIQVLSLEVVKTGCPVLIDGVNPDLTVFPARTFNTNLDGEFLRYNSAAFLINNRVNIFDASLVHTDENHCVFDKGNLGRANLVSEPTYVGGETFRICDPQGPRPTLAFYNSIFRVHTSAALTGVDIQVPNGNFLEMQCPEIISIDFNNVSQLRFYNNGNQIDNGYGRVLVLGTPSGAFACDSCALVDKDSHLDVFQINDQTEELGHMLLLTTSSNNQCITQGLDPDTIVGQCAVQTIFQNCDSNISIGTNLTTNPQFDLTTSPSLCVAGAFFSFETKGGNLGYPEASGTTGVGGIFVDQNGTFKINPTYRTSISTMVVKSGNGLVIVPKPQVYFGSRVGVTNWNINMNDPVQRIVVSEEQCFSDFTLDWGAVIKDFENFTPYDPKQTPSVCDCAPVVEANITNIPVIEGKLQQLQIKRSRIGDQVHLLVDGGTVQETVFLTGFNSAEAPVGFLAIDNDGLLGLGSTHRNIDSLEASIVLGINGVMIVPLGNSTVELNENVYINNVCHILPGPDFGSITENTLRIHSTEDRELRVQSGGVLDLSQFTEDTMVLEFAGNARLVLEPGARVILGGGVLSFTDETRLIFERVLDDDALQGTSPADLDPIRVKFIGTGRVVLEEASSCLVSEQTVVGIESDPTCLPETDIEWVVLNQAKFQIGSAAEPGGAFQIGNTVDNGAPVSFQLILFSGSGNSDALIEINREGFMGLGIGVASKVGGDSPNEWLVGNLFNVQSVRFELRAGTFKHNQIFSGGFTLPFADPQGSLLAIGAAESDAFDFVFDRVNMNIVGGGNMIQSFLVQQLAANRDLFLKQREIRITAPHALNLDALAQEKMQKSIAHIECVLEPGARLVAYDGEVDWRNDSQKTLYVKGSNFMKLRQALGCSQKRKPNTMELCDKVMTTNMKRNESCALAKNGMLCMTKGKTLTNTKNPMMLDTNQLMMLDSITLTESTLTRAEGQCFNPTVLDSTGLVGGTHFVNLFSSRDQLLDNAIVKEADSEVPGLIGIVDTDATGLFNFLGALTVDAAGYLYPIASLGSFLPNTFVVGYLTDLTTINRNINLQRIEGQNGQPVDPDPSLERGAVAIEIDDSTDDIDFLNEIRGGVGELNVVPA